MAERRYGNIPSRMISGSYDNKIVQTRLVKKGGVCCKIKSKLHICAIPTPKHTRSGIIYAGIWWVNTRTKTNLDQLGYK